MKKLIILALLFSFVTTMSFCISIVPYIDVENNIGVYAGAEYLGNGEELYETISSTCDYLFGERVTLKLPKKYDISKALSKFDIYRGEVYIEFIYIVDLNNPVDTRYLQKWIVKVLIEKDVHSYRTWITDFDKISQIVKYFYPSVE